MERNNNIIKNKYGNNTDIKINLLSDRRMTDAGFKDCGETWQYIRTICSYSELSFNMFVHKNNTNEFCICVIDEEFGQYFDWQKKLQKESKNYLALKAKNGVELHMKYLMDIGIVSGHRVGEYI